MTWASVRLSPEVGRGGCPNRSTRPAVGPGSLYSGVADLALSTFIADLEALTRQHAILIVPVVGLISFAESIVFLSLFIPASVILMGIGALVGLGDANPWAVVAAATIGAALGEWASYAVGYVFKDRATQLWPLGRYPDLVARGQRFVHAWGALGLFAAKFIGPLRGIVPMMAGVMAMGPVRFQVANWFSSLLWALVWLAPGYIAVRALH
ncbi:MAG: DedA family protein [Phreatobacter oligotrophus]|nr:DedA family protein [Phreatobacter oligotrophus]